MHGTYFNFGMALSVCVLVVQPVPAISRRHSRADARSVHRAVRQFIFAPRMHERYLCPALIFLVPAALEQPFMMGIFAAITLSVLFNLAYVLKLLRTTGYFAAHDLAAMAASAFNSI